MLACVDFVISCMLPIVQYLPCSSSSPSYFVLCLPRPRMVLRHDSTALAQPRCSAQHVSEAQLCSHVAIAQCKSCFSADEQSVTSSVLKYGAMLLALCQE